MHAPSESTRAFVIRTVDYHESDRIVTLLTERFGKIGVIAKGGRRSQKRFLGALEPFLVIEVQVRSGRGELGWLEQARVVNAFPRILKDLSKIEIAGAAIELVRLGTPVRQPDLSLFSTVVALFQILDEKDNGLQEILLCFQVRLMTLLGFAPCFDSCGHCGKHPGENRAAFFDPRLGHLVCKACGGARIYLSAATRQRLIYALSPNWHRMISDWTEQQRREAKDAVTSFIEYHLEHRLKTASK
jgi:DNA repair protein RecO (recombination protein O)